MNDVIWINGELIPANEARIGVEDRGYQFADGVYEVVRLYDGRPFTLSEHLDRLDRSAGELRMSVPVAREVLVREVHRLITVSGVREGMIYMQLTRGQAPRNHVFPSDPRPTLLFYARSLPPVAEPGHGAGAKLWPVPDERWKRCWIKSIALLPNVLAKNEAVSKGYDEAVFIDEGTIVTECSASNIFAVVNGRVVTHPVGPKVLPGITRLVLQGIAKQLYIPLDERPLRVDEVERAAELFITSTTRELSWVSHWGQRIVGTGQCGPIAKRLHEAFRRRVTDETGATSRAGQARRAG